MMRAATRMIPGDAGRRHGTLAEFFGYTEDQIPRRIRQRIERKGGKGSLWLD